MGQGNTIHDHDSLIELLISNGNRVEDLVIVSSFQAHRDTPVYVSNHGGIDVVFDPMLPPKQLRFMRKNDYKPMSLSEVMQDGSG